MIFFEERQYYLSIETVVGGGSLAIFKGETVIASWRGSREVSKAEDVLEEISNLLKESNLKKNQFAVIIISKSEGNLTGGKIGAAIARGLAKSFNCQLIESSLFESIVRNQPSEEFGNYLSIIPIGEFRWGWKVFEKNSTGLIELIDENGICTSTELANVLAKKNISKILAADKNVPLNHEIVDQFSITIIKSTNLAELNAEKIVENLVASDNL